MLIGRIRILYAADPNVFTSLALLNKKWREISNSSELYYHHLLGCSTPGSANPDPASDLSPADDVSILRNRFIREARRRTFDAFLRPTRTLISLISASASSSSAFPQGEAFRFEFSTNGQRLLALSSSRIFAIDLTTDPISIRHELKTLRRPLTATIGDDGATLAVASSEHQAHIYILADNHAQLMQTVVLSEVPRSLAFSPDSAVLAVAYDGGIEVYAIGEDVLPTARRAVRCSGVDLLTFCREGSMLLGTSNNLQASGLVTISPPLCADPDPDLTMQELESQMWTTQILFPQTHVGYNHAVLIPAIKDEDGSSWFAGYHIQSKAFRLAPIDNPSAGKIYLVGPGPDTDRDEPKPYALPAVSGDGEFVAVGFQGSEVWVYGIPSLKSRVPKDISEQQSVIVKEKEPIWKLPSVTTNFNRLKKTLDGEKEFLHGAPIRLPDGTSAIKWVQDTKKKNAEGRRRCRLVAAAPGGVSSWLGAATGDMLPTDGGRVIVFDFEYSASDGEESELTIELGEVEPINLPEPGSNLDQQVELQRRRTNMNRRGGMGGPRSHSGANIMRPLPRSQPSHNNPSTNGDGPGSLPLIENPYNNSSPRSRDTINRAATAAANRLNPRYQNAREVQAGPRPRAPPHESDADNWTAPPPPYTPKPETPLPEHLQRTLLPSAARPPATGDSENTQLRRSRTARLESVAQAVIARSSTRANRGTNSHEGATLRPINTSINQPQPLPALNTNLSAAPYPAHHSHAVSPAHREAANPIEMYGSGNSPASQETQRLELQYHPSPSHLYPAQTQQVPTPVTGSRVTSQFRDQNQLTVSRTAPITRSSLDRPLPPTPNEVPPRRNWYNIRTHTGGSEPTTPQNQRPSSHGNLMASSGLRTHLSPNHVPDTRHRSSRRPRSRSQDAPRVRGRTPHEGLRDPQTGRRILSSQSDFRIGDNARSDDWLNRSGKKENKCVLM